MDRSESAVARSRSFQASNRRITVVGVAIRHFRLGLAAPTDRILLDRTLLAGRPVVVRGRLPGRAVDVDVALREPKRPPP